MEKISNLHHDKQTLYFCVSRMFERAAYYGLRTILVLYMTGEMLNMNEDESSNIYGLFVGAMLFSQIFGAILGDFLIGNKKTMIIGTIMQVIGAIILCIPSITSLYIALTLIVLGCGLHIPNVISNFGKLYNNKNKLLDSGFTLLYLAVNLGSFLGTFLIAQCGEEYGYQTGFVLSAVLWALSLILNLFTKENKLNGFKVNKLTIDLNAMIILISILLAGLFWIFFDVANYRIYELQNTFGQLNAFNIPAAMWPSLESFILLTIGTIAIIMWTLLYSHQLVKLILGFLFGAISFSILFFIPEAVTEKHISLYLLSMLFLGISEIHIAPIVYSVLTRYSNPKYLATLISLSFVPSRLSPMLFGFYFVKSDDDPNFGLMVAITSMTIISVGLVATLLWLKKHKNNI